MTAAVLIGLATFPVTPASVSLVSVLALATIAATVAAALLGTPRRVARTQEVMRGILPARAFTHLEKVIFPATLLVLLCLAFIRLLKLT